MNIELNLSKDFERELERLRRKYGEEFEKINGVHPSQLDYSEFISKFVDNDTLADTTIDPNANANHKDIRSFMTEKGKSSDKLFALNKIFYEIQKKWGLRTAREWLELEYSKAFYLNDAATASFYPYCYAVSLDRLAKEGLFFLSAYNNQPPKHLTTFFDDVIEFVSFLGNRQSGAVGLPNVIVWAYYFWKKDVENNYHNRSPEDYLRQQYQKLIYRLNQPFLRIDQTAFTNVSIFDTPYLEALFGGLEYPDGTFAIDYVEEIKEAEKTFMEVVAETRKTNMFTFPVLTYSLLYVNGEFQDKEFARWCSDHNVEWQDSNFFVSDNVGVLSNCPMAPSTSIFYKSGNEYEIDTIENVYKKHEKDIIKVLSNGQLVDCKINQFKEKAIYKIRLANGVTLKTTPKHYNKVRGCNYKKSCELSTSDYLPFSIIKWAGEGNESYEHGKLFGILYQNGATIRKYIFDKKDSNIQYAQNIIKKEYLGRADIKEFDEYCELFVTGDKIEECVRKYFLLSNNNIIGVNSAVLSTSLEFRKGFIEGATQKDGSTNYIICNRTDNDLFDQMISSVGYFVVKQSNGDISYITDTEELNNYYYISDEEYVWVKIEEIDKVETKSIYSYCLEVVEKGAKSEFTLPSGLVTHNCRLLSDTSKLDVFKQHNQDILSSVRQEIYRLYERKVNNAKQQS